MKNITNSNNNGNKEENRNKDEQSDPKNNENNNLTDNLFGFAGSRRQKRNMKASQNSNISNNNNILDEKTMNMLKQLENIDLENINMKLYRVYNDRASRACRRAYQWFL